MDQIKIGKFIAERRKNVNLTQSQLAEMLNITDRAVSKWENGKSLPDASIMLSLCDILKITVNDLLSGEVISMENYNKENDLKLIELAEEKQKGDKRLLALELVLGGVLLAVFIALTCIASFVEMEEWLSITLILVGLVPIVIAAPFMLKIEQVAGYYECQKCGHRYVPSYLNVLIAPHINRSRFMHCPECKKFAWHKKVLTKDKE